jgi:hypothetical protein
MSSPRSTWSPGARALSPVSRLRRTRTSPAQPAGTRSCGRQASGTSRSSPAGTPKAAGAGSSCTATAATVRSTSRSSGCSSRSRPPSGPRCAATRCSPATSSFETLSHRGRSSSTEIFVQSAGRPRPVRGSTRFRRPSCSRAGGCSRPSSTRRRCSLGRRKPIVARGHSSRRRMGVGWRSRRRRSRRAGRRGRCQPALRNAKRDVRSPLPRLCALAARARRRVASRWRARHACDRRAALYLRAHGAGSSESCFREAEHPQPPRAAHAARNLRLRRGLPDTGEQATTRGGVTPVVLAQPGHQRAFLGVDPHQKPGRRDQGQHGQRRPVAHRQPDPHEEDNQPAVGVLFAARWGGPSI